MSIIATAVRHLMAAGVTGEPLLEAIADMEAARSYDRPTEADAQPRVSPSDSAAERRRAWDRERKRKAKDLQAVAHSTGIPLEQVENSTRSTRIPPEKVESSAHSTGIPPEQAETPSLSLSPNENNSNPLTHTHEKQTPRARKGSRLPADWMPKPLTEATAQAVAGWPTGSLERELDRFRDWAASATGPNAVKSDWDAAWRNWIRKAEDEGRHRNANNRSFAGSSNVRPFAKPIDGAVTACDDFLGAREPDQPAGRYSPSASESHRGLTLAASRASW